MTRRTKRLTVAVVLTIADVAAADYYCGLIWQSCSRDTVSKAALLGLLSLWIVSAGVIWLHVACDLCQHRRERGGRPAFNAEPGRNSNV
jgi:hypothetical protein